MVHKECDIDDKILSDIEEHGLSVIHIPEDEFGPGYAFSVGLFKKHNHPEVIIFGLNREVMHTIINNIGYEVRRKTKYEIDRLYDDILGNYDCTFRNVEKEWYSSYLGYAKWFYKSIPFPVIQCIWPDKDGSFPWANPTASINRRQPLLYDQFGKDPLVKMTRKWPFNDDKELAVFTCRKVIDKQSEVGFVCHDYEDGSWQFLDDCDHEDVEPVLVCLKDIVSLHPELMQFADLPMGWQAYKDSESGQWIRSILSNDE